MQRSECGSNKPTPRPPKTGPGHNLTLTQPDPRKEATHRSVGQQWLLHHWQIMKCVYISDNHRGQLGNPQKYLNGVHDILPRQGLNNRTHTQASTLTHHRMESNKLWASFLPGS